MLCDMCARSCPLGVKCMNYEHFSQIHVLPWAITLVTLRGAFPALFPSLVPQSGPVDNGCSCSLASFQPF